MNQALIPLDGPPSPQDDYSQCIAAKMARAPLEEIRCVRLFENRYRCNWWMRDTSVRWGNATSGRIVKSRFLRVIVTPQGLLLEELAQ